MERVDVEILQDGSKAHEGVDERLLTLAKQHQAVICTLDYNLNKVAVVEGIQVLNINDIAQALRMAHLPGEELTVELVEKGQDNHQGVGYLADGTMVVVEQASGLIGQAVQVEIVRSLQTSAGKMMFARRVVSASSKHQSVQPARNASPSKPLRRVTTPKHQPEELTQDASSRRKNQQPKDRVVLSARRHTGSRKRIDREAALIQLVDDQA